VHCGETKWASKEVNEWQRLLADDCGLKTLDGLVGGCNIFFRMVFQTYCSVCKTFKHAFPLFTIF